MLGNVNDNTDANNIAMFLSLLYQQKTIKKYQGFSGKHLKASVYWNEHKTKSENKNTINQYRYFLESNFASVNRLLVLVYLNWNHDVKRYKPQIFYLPKAIVKNYNNF